MNLTRNVCLVLVFVLACQSNKPYGYKRFPDSYEQIERDYENYFSYAGCKPGETIASIGAGNGLIETQVSIFNEGITWYLQEIDCVRLSQFDQVLAHHEHILGELVKAEFNLVLGTEKSTNLPRETFDRVLMINVFHEIEDRSDIMAEIHDLLRDDGTLVIMERMARAAGEIHADCKYPILLEQGFLAEMEGYGYKLNDKYLAEELSNLMFYHFESIRK